MTTVNFSTFCHPPHLEKLFAPGVLDEIVGSHHYPFEGVTVVRQRCRGLPKHQSEYPWWPYVHESEAFSDILAAFGIPELDPVADEWTHGPDAAHYWKWHVINHLIALSVCKTDYIVFSDCDCLITESPENNSWVDEGIAILEHNPNVLIVSPSDGGSMAEARLTSPTGLAVRLTRNVSQQCFLARTEEFKYIDFNLPFDPATGMTAPGGPMQEYYWMMEGRIWRYLAATGKWRAILPSTYRYWHYNPWEPQGWIEAGRP